MFDQQTFPTTSADDSLPYAGQLQLVVTSMADAVKKLVSFIQPIIVRVADLFRNVVEGVRQTARNYDKAALLEIYRARTTWKKGDVKNLESYPHRTASARLRIQRLRRLPTAGRPTMGRYIPLAEKVLAELQIATLLCDANTLPHQRVAHLKQSMWWLYYVDALYRGEYLRRQGTPNASRSAEEVVAAELCISRDHLHRLRLSYRNNSGKASSDTGISLQEFEIWKLTGKIPN